MNDLRHGLNSRRQLPPDVAYVEWTYEGPVVYPARDIHYPYGMNRQGDRGSTGSTINKSEFVDQERFQYSGSSIKYSVQIQIHQL